MTDQDRDFAKKIVTYLDRGAAETRTQHRTQRAAAKKQPSTRKLIVEVALRFARYVGRQQLMVARDRVCHATHVANPA